MESFSEPARLPGKKPNILTVDIDVPLGGAGGRRVVPQRPRFVFRFSVNPFPRRPASGHFFLFWHKIVSACQRKNDGNFHEKRGRIVSLSLPHNPLYMFGLLDVG
jgi:hypothetical protein